MKGAHKNTGSEQEKGPKQLETQWSHRIIHSEGELRTPVVRRLLPLQVRQGRAFEPPRKAPGAGRRLHLLELSVLPSRRPSAARLGAPRGHLNDLQGTGERRPRCRRLLFHPHGAQLEAWARRSCPGKSCCAPSAQCPGPRPALQNLARPLHPRDEYLQPSDPGWERLGKAHQPLATAVQQLPEAAAGSGTRALSCDPAAATLDWARAPQHRAQQQP